MRIKQKTRNSDIGGIASASVIGFGSMTMVYPEEDKLLPCWATSSVAALYNNGDYPGKTSSGTCGGTGY